jgi:hypothetical protein
MLEYTVRQIPSEQTYDWLLKKHYAHRIPSISFAFGLYDRDLILTGVCTFGQPPNQNIAFICGDKYKDNLLELNRLVLSVNIPNLASYFISKCFGLLTRPLIIVSYSDPNYGHQGYIYQALNGLYTGCGGENKEYIYQDKRYNSRHIKDYWFASRGVKFDYSKSIDEQFKSLGGTVVDVEQKHRYIFFLADKRDKKEMLRNFKWKILPYPKGDNKRYDASYQPPIQRVLV